jgi:membrane protein DedA with SNARE-associated domain
VSSALDQLLGVPPALAYTLVTALVFIEDALFVGFVFPGETAAVLGGVMASRSDASLGLMMTLVISAAIIGDSVGYEVGRVVGPRLLNHDLLVSRKAQLENAQDFLRRRGGLAVFLGRFIAFFRAVMPALAGISRMKYRKFLAFNAIGGIVWGGGAVLVGYLAGNSYHEVEKVAGRGSAAGAVAVIVIALVIWQIRRYRIDRAQNQAAERDAAGDEIGDGNQDAMPR